MKEAIKPNGCNLIHLVFAIFPLFLLLNATYLMKVELLFLSLSLSLSLSIYLSISLSFLEQAYYAFLFFLLVGHDAIASWCCVTTSHNQKGREPNWTKPN